MGRKLYRSRRERMVSGVCGGIAEYFEIDPTLIRLIAVVLAVASFGTAFVVYLVMAIVVPEEPADTAEGSGTAMSTPPGPAAPAPPPAATVAPVAAPPAPPAPPTAPPTPPPGAGQPQHHRRGRGGVAFGVILVFLGLALLVSQFVPGIELWRMWPLIIVVIGIRVMFRSRSAD
jgi:phage shock protein C